MSDLQNQTPADTYKGLLQVGDYTDGITNNTGATALQVTDGAGVNTALALSTTRVGVGNNSPQAELDVSGGIESTTLTTSGAVTAGSIDVSGNVVADEYALDQTGTSSSAVAIHAPAPNELAIRTNSTEAMRIDSSGQIGINTATPTRALDVSGSIKASGTLDVSSSINSSGSISTTARHTINRKDVSGVWNRQPSLYLRLTPGTQAPPSKDYGVLFSNADGIAIHADTTDIESNTYTPHLLVYSPGTTGSPGRVGINTVAPSAPLEVSSTIGGVIMPRMTTTQMNAISSPTDGEMIYNTTANKFYGRANGSWVALH